MDAAVGGADGDVRLALRVRPGAKRTELVDVHGGRIKLDVAAPPVDGKANKAVVAWFAGLLGVRKSAVEISAGAHSRDKTVRIRATLHEVREALRARVLAGE